MAKPRITWEKHGDILVMMANGWKRGVVYFEGGWWGVGIFGSPGQNAQMRFCKNKRDIKRVMVEAYRLWSGHELV